MSLWRKKAIDYLPELKTEIESSENHMQLWIELQSYLSFSYTDKNTQDLIKRIFDYAKWCYYDSKNTDLVTSLIVAFYEHLPLDKKICDELDKWIDKKQFNDLKEVFKYHSTEMQFKDLEKKYL